MYKLIGKSDSKISDKFYDFIYELLHNIRLGKIQLIESELLKKDEEIKEIQGSHEEEIKEITTKLSDNKQTKNQLNYTRAIQHHLDKICYKAKHPVMNFEIIFNTRRDPLVRLNERVKELKKIHSITVPINVIEYEIEQIINN